MPTVIGIAGFAISTSGVLPLVMSIFMALSEEYSEWLPGNRVIQALRFQGPYWLYTAIGLVLILTGCVGMVLFMFVQ